MKKITFLMGLLIMAGAMIFTSCTKDEDDPIPTDLTPTITFMGGAGYISADAELITASSFVVGITATENATSSKNIATFTVTRIFDNVPTIVYEEDNIGEPNYTWQDTLVAHALPGAERWTFTVEDKDGLTSEVSFIITTIPNVTILSYSDLDMGSWNSAEFGSFLATSTGTVMMMADATAAQASVDMAFYLGAVNGSTFGAPSNSDVQDVFDLVTVQGWTLLNETLFQMADISGADFDAIGGTYTFPEFTGTADDIKNLANGDVIYFKTVNDKYGFIKVNSINGKGDVCNIDLKVME